MSIALCFENEQCDVLKMSNAMFWKWAVPYVLKMSRAICFENEQCHMFWKWAMRCFENEQCHMFWKWAVPYVLKKSTAMFWKWALPCFENEHCHASCLPEIPGQTRISNAHPVFFLSVDSGSHEWIKKKLEFIKNDENEMITRKAYWVFVQ